MDKVDTRNATMTQRANTEWLSLIAGILAVVGAFLPWATAQSPDGYSTISVSGVDSRLVNLNPPILDGWYTVVFGAILIVIALVGLDRRHDWAPAQAVGALILAGLLGCIAIKNIVPLANASAAVATSWFGQYVSVNVGAGLMLIAGAAGLGALGGALGGLSRVLTNTTDPASVRGIAIAASPTMPATALVGASRGASVSDLGIYRMVGRAGWGTDDDLYCITFSDAVTGWMVGRAGMILCTKNSAAKWARQRSGVTDYLYGVACADAASVWAVGLEGTILHTTDGGANWTKQSSGTTNTLHSVAFINAQSGWAVGGAGTVLRTVDGGARWGVCNTGVNYPLRSLKFIDARTGWVVGREGAILRTTDGGAQWTMQHSPSTGPLFGVTFVDENNGWAVGGNGVILHTGDGGLHWSAQHSGMSETLTDVVFQDALRGWVICVTGRLLHTADGGATWK